tara:strand:+ start:2054 stop:3052 length:999 start_codon:yes stop_codon:yes gene_type:complete
MKKDLKVFFLSSGHNVSSGSYRIWIHDLNKYFREVGVNSSTSHENPKNLEDSDVIICGKENFHAAAQLKKLYPSKKVGVINLSSDKKGLPIDFVIVGSLEEKDSLSHYSNVFLYPLIERMYQDPDDYKQHKNSSPITIGFHGHYPHLSKFSPHLSQALEDMEKIHNIKLKIITSYAGFDWKVGKPKIKNISMKSWDIKTIKQEILGCDIGVVPNITSLNLNDLGLKTSANLGLYDTDLAVRMKNKSNAGRCFVFHQLGIPVVADLTPSNFHIMGDPECGSIAMSSDGWLKALINLTEPETRQRMADNAKREFDRLYDPHVWARRLYTNLLEI